MTSYGACLFPYHSCEYTNRALRSSPQARATIKNARACMSVLRFDRRESLSSKEQQLATYGVRWTMDAAYDTELAQQMEAAH